MTVNLRSRSCLIGAACVLAALFGATVVQAHNWGCWIQPDRTVKTYNTAGLRSQATSALQEWDSKTILAVPLVSYHTDISVYDGYYGNTGWAGLASIENYSGCKILHGHAKFNRSYSSTSNGYRGIFCQEVGHLFGLDHSNDGGCMGGGYWYDINTHYNVVQHNISDISTKYAKVPTGAPAVDEEQPLALGELASHALLSAPSEGRVYAMAFWHNRPHTLEEAVERSVAVVRGRVLTVSAGPDITVPVDGSESGADMIPTRRILFAVDKVLAGQIPGSQVELFQTGDANFVLEEDPPYAVGEQYVLFLTNADHGRYRPISPEGRIRVSAGGLAPSSTREFMSEVRGRSVESFSSDVARLTPTPSGATTRVALQLRRTAMNLNTSHTSISYALPGPSAVELGVFDVQGRLVRSLVNGRQDGPRWYSVEWDGRNERLQPVANGLYFIRLLTPTGIKSISVPVVRGN